MTGRLQYVCLTSVTLPSTLKIISDYSFAECPLLNNVTLPSNLQTIRSYAFQKCAALTKIVIPDSVTSFGKTRLGSIETGYVLQIAQTLNRLHSAQVCLQRVIAASETAAFQQLPYPIP